MVEAQEVALQVRYPVSVISRHRIADAIGTASRAEVTESSLIAEAANVDTVMTALLVVRVMGPIANPKSEKLRQGDDDE